MKVIQILSTLSFGDAVSNDVLALEKVIQSMGYQTGVYAEILDARLPKSIAKKIDAIPKLSDKDIIIYHLSTGSYLNYKLSEYRCKKIVVYHNITPAHFFEDYSANTALLCNEGIRGVKNLSDKVDYCMAVSQFNKTDLVNMGYQCPIDVLPIVIPFEDYRREPDEQVVSKYSDGYTNILFTGRIAPNKKQEDVIRAFYYYKKYYNAKSRLILVGSHIGMDRYYARLKSYINALDLQNDVIFPGHIKFEEVLAYYKTADVFLCQSEHEGFCVPLVEAMFFEVPIIAYNSTAIPDTLGGSGIVLDEKNAIETAGMINRVVQDSNLRDEMIRREQERLKDFREEVVAEQFKKYLENFIKTM